jgi:hypothetical protein
MIMKTATTSANSGPKSEVFQRGNSLDEMEKKNYRSKFPDTVQQP